MDTIENGPWALSAATIVLPEHVHRVASTAASNPVGSRPDRRIYRLIDGRAHHAGRRCNRRADLINSRNRHAGRCRGTEEQRQ
jgi:hypothetical protein